MKEPVGPLSSDYLISRHIIFIDIASVTIKKCLQGLYKNPGPDPQQQQWQGKTPLLQREALSKTRLSLPADGRLSKGGGEIGEDR